MRKVIIAMSMYVSIILFPSSDVVAQSGAPFLTLTPSPYSIGIGGAGVALPTDDPFKAFHNPALLGLSENNSNLSTSFYLQPNHIRGFSEMQYSNYALNAGYDLSKISEDIPLYIGISFIRQNIDWVVFTLTDIEGKVIDKINSREFANSFSIGIGYSYYVDFAVGFTYRDINIERISSFTNESAGNANAGAYDIGILLSYPVLSSYELCDALSTNLNVSTGWSINNVGDDLEYDNNKNPLLPRQTRLGYGVKSDLIYKVKDIPFKLLTVEWTMEANDLLINADNVGFPYEYESGLMGDINVVDDIISGKNHDGVVIRRGFRATIAELFSISVGSYKYEYGIDDLRDSFGRTVHTNGLFKVLNAYFGNGVLDFLASHIDIRYIYGQYDVEEKYQDHTNPTSLHQYTYTTDYSGMELRIFNVDL